MFVARRKRKKSRKVRASRSPWCYASVLSEKRQMTVQTSSSVRAIPSDRPTAPNLFAESGTRAPAPVPSSIELDDDDVLEVETPPSAKDVRSIPAKPSPVRITLDMRPSRVRVWSSD